MFGRQKIAMITAEFIGTFVLSSVILTSINVRLFPLFVALAASVAFLGMRLAFGSASGGYYNPALVIADWTVRRIETAKAAVLVAVQMLAGLIAWNANEYFIGSPLKNLVEGLEFDWRIFAAEAMGAFIFALTFAAAARQAKTSKSISDTTASVGLALGILVASVASNALINPAVALGVLSFNFTYAAAPILGALIAVNLYESLFAPRTLKAKVVAKAKSVKKVAKKATVKKTIKKK
jgi:glycerol uptake facilitator-like aquaporin